MNRETSSRRFIRESLPLLSSYFYSEDVVLEPVDLEIGLDATDEYQTFANVLRMRHAVACGLKLKPILEAVERGVSHVPEIVRSESKGTVYGRLDIQLYINSRSTNMSWPRYFPVLVATDSPNTPENQLIAETLRQIAQRLNESQLIDASAERAYCLNLLRWTREQIHSEPWVRVTPIRASERLRREAEHRLRKRQTGNETAYLEFLNWHSQWVFDASHSSPDETEAFVNLLLAFPQGDFFEDRVFEIWCLYQLIESFRRAGAVVIEGPRPLSHRSGQPTYLMRYGNYRFDVWFQRPLPNAVANWRYLSSGRPLAGIPDITVIGIDGRRFLIDAKRRDALTNTRPEETYKMLGYLENFRSIFRPSPFWAVLCFLSEKDLYTEVVEESGHKLFLVGAHPQDPRVCAFGGRMDTVISEWLSLRLD